MQWIPKFQYASRSDVGMKRQNNEDSYCVQLCPEEDLWFSRGHLFAVADGMGGHEVGELASKTALSTLPHVYYKSGHEMPADALHESLIEANRAIYEISARNRDFKRMGTTCTSLVVHADGVLIGHVGDSRIYRIRGERIDQLSFDHTVAWEQKLRKRRQPDQLSEQNIDPEKYGHVLTRCLGPDPTVRVDIEGPFEYLPGDIYILCSDGVTKYLSDLEIGTYSKALPPADASRLLINLANLRGGADNSTVVIVKIGKQEGVLNQPPTEDFKLPRTQEVWIQPALFTGTLLSGIGAGFLSYFQWAIPAALLGVLACVLLISAYLVGRMKPNPEFDTEEDLSEGSSTIFFRPYRTAAIRLSMASVSKLKDSVIKLEQVARENNWSCRWSEYEEKFQSAEQTVDGRKYQAAILAWAQLLDLLYAAMPRS